MTSKEKQAAVGGALILAALGLVQFVILPANGKIETARKLAADSDQALEDLHALSQKSLALKGDLDRVRERVARAKGDVGALSVLESLEKECGLTQGNVPYMKPEPAVVENGYAQARITVRLEGISESQLRQLLKRIQTADLPMGVRSLELKTSRKAPALLDATIEVISVTLAGRG